MWILSIIVVAGVTRWAVGRSIQDPAPGEPVAPVTATVTEGRVGRVVPATATVSWNRLSSVKAGRDGVVTSLAEPGVVRSGSVLARLDEVPTIVAEGVVPAFRDLGLGDEGRDVMQLQQMLADLDLLASGNDGVDGDYGPSTVRAFRALEKSLGGAAPPDGRVTLGEVVFVPDLPATFTTPDGLAVGDLVSAGTEVALVRAPAPQLDIRTEGDAAAELRSAVDATVEIDGQPTAARLGTVTTTDEGLTSIALELVDGCADACQALSDGEQLTVRVEVVPPVAGPVLPVAAVRQGDDGNAFVVTSAGKEVAVTVLGADRGVAVVDGIDVGTDVRLVSADEASS